MARKKQSKKRPKKNSKAQAPKREIMVYAGLAVLIILLASAVAVLVEQQSEDKLTSWAFIKSQELSTFFGDCRNTGGYMDVRPSAAPQIVFICTYADRMVEYTMLPPGKK